MGSGRKDSLLPSFLTIMHVRRITKFCAISRFDGVVASLLHHATAGHKKSSRGNERMIGLMELLKVQCTLQKFGDEGWD